MAGPRSRKISQTFFVELETMVYTVFGTADACLADVSV